MTAFDMPGDINASCAHSRVKHRHGTYACYTLDRCRCTACSKVTVAYRSWETRQRHYARLNPGEERFQPYVDAAPVFEHLKALQAAGLSYKEVARRAGVAASSLGAVLWATPSRGRKRRTKVARTTRDRVLSVPLPTPEQLLEGRRISAVPTRNRVHALQAIGYSHNEIARRAGVDVQVIRRAADMLDAGTTVATHKAVAGVFADLWATPNEPTEHKAKCAASRARNAARRAGYPLPIDLNDDGYVESDDTVNAESSEPKRTGRQGIDLDDFAHLLRGGVGLEEALRRVGAANIGTITQAAHRHSRPDVLQLVGEVAA